MDIKKLNYILMRTVAVLLLLVLVTSSMISGRFARYVTTASFEDGARVAKFNIIETKGPLMTQMEIDILPGTSTSVIDVKNYSEVAVAFTITVESLYDNIPLIFQVLDGDTVLATSAAKEDLIFTDTIGAGQDSRNFQLQIIWPVSDTNINYCGRVDLIQVTLDAVQVD